MQTLERLEQVKEIVYQATRREPHDLPEFIDEACGNDAAMRREVESLLAAYRHNRDFLQAPALDLLGENLRALLDDDEASAIGQRVGSYVIVREIGRGGMSEVYLAERDDGEFRRQVAVKLIKQGLDTKAVLRRFRKERQILADLDHPNIARLLDGGMTDDGRPYFVMEYIEGRPIDEHVEAHHLSVEGRLRLFRTVCEAVSYAHERKVIHRDLKPGNILITGDGTPKLVDFGIARLLDAESRAATATDTPTALRAMTPEYASPEQLRGHAVTETSDVYSLGVMLYELLTGRRPFDFRSRLPHEILRTIEHQEPPRPSEAATRTHGNSIRAGSPALRDDLSIAPTADASFAAPPRRPVASRLTGDLDNIILMAIRKESENRYVSVEQFSEDIRRHLDGLPVIARGDTLLYKGVKFIRRHRTSTLTTLAVALLCLLIGISLGLFSRRGGQPKDRGALKTALAVLPFANASPHSNSAYLSDGITNIFINNLARLSELSVPAYNSVALYKDSRLDLPSVGRELRVGKILTGTVGRQGEDIFINLELVDMEDDRRVWRKQYRTSAAEILTLQPVMVNDVVSELGLSLTPEEQALISRRYTDDVEAYDLYLKGRYVWGTRTSHGFGKAVDYFQQAIRRDPNYALAYSGLADSFSMFAAYKLVAPKEAFTEAKAAALKAVELDDGLAQARTSLALVHWLYDWDWEGADREFRRALELDPRYPLAPHWYGLYLAEMGRFDEAIASVNQALDIDPRSPYIHADLGRVLFYARRYEESLAQYRRTMEIAPSVLSYYGDLGYLYEQLGMDEELYSIVPHADVERIQNVPARKRMKTYWESQFAYLNRGIIAPSYYRAEIYARVGKNDLAIQELNRVYDLRDHQMAQLKVNPVFDGLRADPRFKELLGRMKLDS